MSFPARSVVTVSGGSGLNTSRRVAPASTTSRSRCWSAGGRRAWARASPSVSTACSGRPCSVRPWRAWPVPSTAARSSIRGFRSACRRSGCTTSMGHRARGSCRGSGSKRPRQPRTPCWKRRFGGCEGSSRPPTSGIGTQTRKGVTAPPGLAVPVSGRFGRESVDGRALLSEDRLRWQVRLLRTCLPIVWPCARRCTGRPPSGQRVRSLVRFRSRGRAVGNGRRGDGTVGPRSAPDGAGGGAE